MEINVHAAILPTMTSQAYSPLFYVYHNKYTIDDNHALFYIIHLIEHGSLFISISVF